MPRRTAAIQEEEPEESGEELLDDEEDEEVDRDAPDIETPFDAGLNEVVLDFRTVSELPFDTDASGVKAFRAFIFEKGKVLHSPTEAGQYYASGEWCEQWALSIVHFKPATKRKHELLLNFVDYGMLSQTQWGISVESLSLPLRLAKNIYQDTPRLTEMKDVAGFSTINAGLAPWSISLAACLKKLPLFKAHDVLMPKHLEEWVKKKTLKERLNNLELITRKAVAAEVESMRRQDEGQAEKTQAIFLARLAKTMEAVNSLPPQAYDVEQRVTLLTIDGETPPITTPLRKSLLDGEAQLLRTQLVPRAKPIVPPIAIGPLDQIPEEVEPTSPTGEEDVVATEAANLFGEGGGPTIVVNATGVVVTGARNRMAPMRYDSMAPALGSKKPKKAGALGKAPAGAHVGTEEAPWGINERTGEPYKRQPYSKKDPSIAALTKAAAIVPAPVAATSADVAALAKAKAKIDELKEKVNVLQLKLAASEKDVAVLVAGKALAVSEARANGAEEAKRGFLNIILESKEEYKKGLRDGARLATGRTFELQGSSCRTSIGGSSAAASASSKKRNRPRSTPLRSSDDEISD